jgi:hypothetical protein
MVLLSRSVGIPARLMTGFLPGEWNDFGQYLTVRQRDAHAWVEIYFPKSGWVTFDPTPSDDASGPIPLLLQVGRVIDSIRLKWDRFVIQYSFRDQLAVAHGIREGGEKLRAELGNRTRPFREWLLSIGRWPHPISVGGVPTFVALALGIVMMVVLGMLAVRRVLRARQGTRPSHADVAIMALYERMIRILKGRGFVKPRSSTPFEFAREIRRSWAEASPCVDPLTELYCRVRFGDAPLTREDLRQADALLHTLTRTVSIIRSEQLTTGG